MFEPEFSPDKFRALMLYAAHRARESGDRWFGAVKLNKILYYSDFLCYQRHGRPITGAHYQKLEEGPAPKELLREREHLIAQGLAQVTPVQVFNYVQHRLVPTAPSIAADEHFDEHEIAVIDEVIRELEPLTAAEVSEMSHREMGWRGALLKEEIPYETAFLAPLPYES